MDPANQVVETSAAFNDGSMVVVYVLTVVMAAIFAFMIMTDRKISRVEKEMND